MIIEWIEDAQEMPANLKLFSQCFHRGSQALPFRDALIDVLWLQPIIQVKRTVARSLFQNDDQQPEVNRD